MDRRRFLSSLGASLGGIVLSTAIPLGRIYSFPTKIRCLNLYEDEIFARSLIQSQAATWQWIKDRELRENARMTEVRNYAAAERLVINDGVVLDHAATMLKMEIL